MPLLSYLKPDLEARIIGTCFKILPCLALTARHVVDEWLGRYAGQRVDDAPLIPQSASVELNIKAVEFPGPNRPGRTWSVSGVYTSALTDAAILTLSPDAGEWGAAESPVMSAIPPREGDEVFAVGWPDSRTEETDRGLKITVHPQKADGRVVELHHEGRDRGFMPFPVAHTSLEIRGGMSGGPVFNKEGELLGLLCASLEQEDTSAEPVSYVALLWPMLSMQLNVPREGKPPGVWYRLLDLALDGPLNVRGARLVKIDEGGGVSLDLSGT